MTPAMKQPLCVDLFCGLGGWTEGFLAEGWRCVGFDIERHVYGEHCYPAQLVLQDVRSIDGKQFKDADMIVASSPCQAYSYMAMPWKRAKQIARALRGQRDPETGKYSLFPEGYDSYRSIAELNDLFEQPKRIQREAIEAAGGRFIPLIQENVRGAIPWVGRPQWHYGSFYLWGDVPALMPATVKAVKVGGLDWNDRTRTGQAFNTHAERAIKNSGGSWFAVAHNTTSGVSNNARDALVAATRDGVKQPGISGPRANGKGDRWFQDGVAGSSGGKSTARKAASAAIAKIPFALASHIARVYSPARRSA